MSMAGRQPSSATAFAPATVGNVGIGFDILGHTLDALGDRVTVQRSEAPGVRIVDIRGLPMELPQQASANTAGRALQSLLRAQAPGLGLSVEIDKGIPLGSGLGGSAASAVAAVVAGNALLDEPLPLPALLPHALDGEAVASGARHADNVAPSLLGGLVLTVGIDAPVIRQLPVPEGIVAVAVHPRFFLSTRAAREVLAPTVPLAVVIWQSAHLAGFIAGCCISDLALIRASLEDVMIEPQRARLIPGFAEVKQAALDCGALGCSISGAGPTVFAWCEAATAGPAAAAMAAAFARHGLESDSWTAPIRPEGARVIARA